MRTDLAYLHTSDYLVNTPVFEGPLDLLLQLIERAELDITKLALAHVTDQYLLRLRALPEREAGEVSAFLIIAAKLLQIKSEALLPRAAIGPEGKEDTGESLVRQLLDYKRFKELADVLAGRENAGLRTYLRLAPSPKTNGRVEIETIDLFEFLGAAGTVFERELHDNLRPSLRTVVPGPIVTVREKIKAIAALLGEVGKTTFRGLVGEKRSRMQVVVTFLAMLELVKRYLVRVSQPDLFGDIEVESAESWNDFDDFELEFGE